MRFIYNMVNNKVAYIEWVDSYSLNNEESVWKNISSLNTDGVIIKSFGFIIKESTKSITIVSSMHDDSISGDITIPKSCINRIKRYQVSKKGKLKTI